MQKRRLIVGVALAWLMATGGVQAEAPTTTAESLAIRKLLGSSDEAQLEQAMTRAEAQAESLPDSAEAHYWLGAAYGRMAQEANMFSAAGYARKVKAEFERSAELDPRLFEAQYGLIQFHLQAPGFMGGDEDEAKRIADELATLDAVAGHRAQATLKSAAKDRAGAKAEMLAALAIRPADPEVLSVVVGMYDQDKQYTEMGAAVRAALAIDPEHVVIRYQFGKYAALSGQDLEEGLKTLDALLAITPAPEKLSAAGMHWRRGQILAHLNRLPEAIIAVQQAAKLEPKSKEIAVNLAHLKKS
ncbi:hypothetical protein C7S18_21915 [Ahniella affigens]|uniref:Uncharacterized protein n=1 Tax=Ahniella affigens TaxID=2021234 RepID=A0A2P1PXU9_9GAMM|nr:tetratricopeptide repeat protein [Ahniella affigens]AVP99667.1 hypothetical protein C7S18_21915 [Ahniella affigens]